LSKNYRLQFISFTPYNGDLHLMEKLSCRLANALVSTAADPVAKFHAVGRLRGLVCSSLHAAIFAYAQGIPVLAYPYVPKVRYFFDERGLGDRLFQNEEELNWKLEALESKPSNYVDTIEADKKAVRVHLDRVADVLAVASRNPCQAQATART